MNDLTGGGVVEAGGMAKPDFEVVAQLGHGTNAGSGGLDGVALGDGDGWTYILYGFHIRPVERLHELPRVRAEGFDVASLSFRMQSLEY